jgi:hypothetical protein
LENLIKKFDESFEKLREVQKEFANDYGILDDSENDVVVEILI